MEHYTNFKKKTVREINVKYITLEDEEIEFSLVASEEEVPHLRDLVIHMNELAEKMHYYREFYHDTLFGQLQAN